MHARPVCSPRGHMSQCFVISGIATTRGLFDGRFLSKHVFLKRIGATQCSFPSAPAKGPATDPPHDGPPPPLTSPPLDPLDRAKTTLWVYSTLSGVMQLRGGVSAANDGACHSAPSSKNEHQFTNPQEKDQQMRETTHVQGKTVPPLPVFMRYTTQRILFSGAILVAVELSVLARPSSQAYKTTATQPIASLVFSHILFVLQGTGFHDCE